MKTQAYFEKIHQQITLQLNKSSKSILLAIAWLTDDKLYNILCAKAKEGVEVQILIANNEINLNSKLNFSELKENGGEIYWIGKNFNYAPLMHNKFCIIDNEVLIFGSYNWTRKARTNHESITVIEGDKNLLLDFNQEFVKIKSVSTGEKSIFDWKTLFLRLEALSKTIQIGDEEDIQYQLEKLKSLVKKNSDNEIEKVTEIINFCQQKEYSKAVSKIQDLTSRYKKLTIYEDPEIPALKLEIRALKLQVTSLEDEKTDIEKLIGNFNKRYNEEVGELLERILFLKKEAARRNAEKDSANTEKQKSYREAQSDYRNFSESFKESLAKLTPAELSKEDTTTLKSKYREATKICHPDMVPEEQKELAEKIFRELKAAYEQNDISKVSEILKNLKKGVFKARGENVTQKDKLQILLNNLIQTREELEEWLTRLKGSDVYLKLVRIEDWDQYFIENKNTYQEILEDLEKQVNYE